MAIRTIVIKGNEAFFNVGGGIVWDSVPRMNIGKLLTRERLCSRY